jgi:prolyl oligopeptidase
MIDRRKFLTGGVSTLAAFLSATRPRAATSRAPASVAPAVPPAPVARIDVVQDVYFGETLSDPYRWMENDKDREWLPFLKGQNRHARTLLEALPQRKALLARIQQLSGDTALTSDVQRAGGLTFIQQRPQGADNYRLFVRENGRDRILVDPTTLGGAAGHVSLDWWRASPDGRHLVYGLSKNGSEDSILHVLRVADGRDLPERIANTQAANPQWLDDASWTVRRAYIAWGKSRPPIPF